MTVFFLPFLDSLENFLCMNGKWALDSIQVILWSSSVTKENSEC